MKYATCIGPHSGLLAAALFGDSTSLVQRIGTGAGGILDDGATLQTQPLSACSRVSMWARRRGWCAQTFRACSRWPPSGRYWGRLRWPEVCSTPAVRALG